MYPPPPLTHTLTHNHTHTHTQSYCCWRSLTLHFSKCDQYEVSSPHPLARRLHSVIMKWFQTECGGTQQCPLTGSRHLASRPPPGPKAPILTATLDTTPPPPTPPPLPPPP